jgi:outer membrane lipoprotein SlyB
MAKAINRITGQPVEDVIKSIELMRKEYFTHLAEGKTEEQALYIVETKMYQYGITATKLASITMTSVSAASTMSTAVASGAMASPVAWAFAGFIFAAQTGTDHQKVKKGEMTKDQFNQNLKVNAVKMGGGVLGSSGGALAGFLIGTAICPGVGTLIGTFAGAVSGGIAGNKIAQAMLEEIEGVIKNTNGRRDQIR